MKFLCVSMWFVQFTRRNKLRLYGKLCPLGIVLASACVETQFIASYKGSHPLTWVRYNQSSHIPSWVFMPAKRRIIIYKTQWIASLQKTMSIRNCLSRRLCRDAIYCVLQKHEFYIKKVRTKSTVASDNWLLNTAPWTECKITTMQGVKSRKRLLRSKNLYDKK